MRRRGGAGLALLGAALSCACLGSRAGSDAREPTSTTLEVRRGEFVERFLATGELQAVRSYDLVVPRMPSWETSIRWLEADGARVSEGQTIVEFDDTAFGRDLEEKRLARDQARSDLEQKEAEIATTLADREFQVAQRRIAFEKARSDASVPPELLPDRQVQERRLALERAEVEHAKAIEDLEAAREATEEEITQRRIQLEKTEREIAAAERALATMALTAPRDGIFVVENHPWEGRKLQVGDNVWIGVTIGKIPDLASMRVTMKISDVDDGRVAAGMKAACTLDAWPDDRFEGRIVEITPVAQEVERLSLRRAFDATVELDRTDPERMRPGMSVKVEIEAARREGVLLAPRAALEVSPDGACARTEDGECVEVGLGGCNAIECVIEGGLQEGARLRAAS